MAKSTSASEDGNAEIHIVPRKYPLEGIGMDVDVGNLQKLEGLNKPEHPAMPAASKTVRESQNHEYVDQLRNVPEHDIKVLRIMTLNAIILGGWMLSGERASKRVDIYRGVTDGMGIAGCSTASQDRNSVAEVSDGRGI